MDGLKVVLFKKNEMVRRVGAVSAAVPRASAVLLAAFPNGCSVCQNHLSKMLIGDINYNVSQA